MKLHLGCGTVYLKNYTNVDFCPDYLSHNCPPELLEQNLTTFENYYKQEFGTLSGHIVADLQHDLRKPLPFDIQSIDEIVMYQVLEHFPFYNLHNLLSEISRVLKIGGAFFVNVPDVKKTAKMLTEAQTEQEEDWAIRLIHGTQRNEGAHHYCGFIPRTLKRLLSKYDFVDFIDMPSINFYPTIHIKAIKGAS